FGRMGEKPSHPELLDFLAVKFSDDFDWSMKKVVKYLVSTDAFHRSSEPPADVATKDPENKLLSHFPVKRLEAEAVRDSLLLASGRLTRDLYGAPADGGAPRRSVYVRVIRNNLDPFLSVYDSPVPFSTTGRRSETNVPAQSLTMLNNGFVVGAAAQFANAIKGETDTERIQKMWLTALGREPSPEESSAAKNFLDQMRTKTDEIAAKRKTLEAEVNELQAKRNGILKPIREKLEAELATKNADQEKKGPVNFNPIGHWDFSKGTEDFVGDSDVNLVGGATIEDGALIVGKGIGMTKPLGQNLKAKTLEVRVQLNNLMQTGGGAMSVQGLAGEPFDSITFAERQPKRWMAGSSGFRRTQDFGGTDEIEANTQPIHFVITYAEDGTIRGYRNGKPYGKPYKTGVQEYQKGDSQVIFGLRHGKGPGTGRQLYGKIFEARLYDRALTEQEVAALGTGKLDFVPESKIRDALTDAQKSELKKTEMQIAKLNADREALGTGLGEGEVWKNLAHSIFNLKEFIYLY
ncbi:MAG: DUF1553 domain-containing protein, partial [Verrucomicrobiales bacterium]|nr:DUF1553 domain-containing protein [Verrucomicrobiales bacterium]